MRKYFLLIFFFPFICLGQEYLDLFKIGYGQSFKNDFKEVDGNTRINSFKTILTFPIAFNEHHALITGADFSFKKLQLYPEAKDSNLYSTMFTFGLASTWSKKWSTTFVLLPKIASDYSRVTQEDLFIGGIAILKFKKSENLLYRFGVYASEEAFGVFATPILGVYYMSPNKKFEIDLSLPIKGDMNYKLGRATLGLDYFGISRSFNLHNENESAFYVDLNAIEFSTYLQFNLINKSILVKTKLGYSSDDYKIFAKDDKMDFALSAFKFGDNRTQLNPTLQGSLFVKLEFNYRYSIIKSKPKNSDLESN